MSNEQSNLALLLWNASARDSDRLALIERDQRTTVGELAFRTCNFAHALRDAGVRPGDRVAIFLERGPDAIAALFGAYAVGAVAVMVNEFYRPLQIEYVLEHCTAAALVTSQEMLDRQHRDLECAVPILLPDRLPTECDFEPVRRIAPDLAQIIYTSGSTGTPKGVVYAHGALQSGIRAVSGYLGLLPEDRVASLLPFSSVYGLNQVLTALAVGACVVVERALLPHQLAVGLAERGTTVLAAVPPLWIQLLGAPPVTEGALRGIRIAQNAGGHMPPEVVRALRQALPDAHLFLQYGMTETFRGSFLPPQEVDRRPDSMGRAMPDTELLLLDENERPVAVGEVGEIVHRGPTIALGYWNDPDATARTFRPNPVRPAGTPDTERVVFSGDMARRDDDGFLYFVSRRDRLIKSMGFRVGPDEIADLLLRSGELIEVLIDAEPDDARGERIIAHVVLAPTGELERLRRFVRAEVPAYAQPAAYVPWDAIPRLPSSKYDIAAVRESRETSGPDT